MEKIIIILFLTLLLSSCWEKIKKEWKIENIKTDNLLDEEKENPQYAKYEWEISFIYNSKWEINTNNLDRKNISLEIKNVRYKSLGNNYVEKNIKIDIFYWKNKEKINNIWYWLFWGKNYFKEVVNEKWEKIYLNIFVNYLSDLVTTDETPWAKEFREELEKVNNIYKPDIDKFINSIK